MTKRQNPSSSNTRRQRSSTPTRSRPLSSKFSETLSQQFPVKRKTIGNDDDSSDSGSDGSSGSEEYIPKEKKKPRTALKRSRRIRESTDSDGEAPETLRIKKRTTMYSQFIELVQQSLYTVDAFPTLKNSRLSTEEIVYHLKKKSPDDDAPVDQDLVDDFMEITSSKRTNLHSGVGDWLDVKSFPLTKFPAACSDSRQELYRYLLEHNRIFRRGYDDRGRFMFNDCIADCLQFTLLNTTNGPSRLRPVPDIIPRELICLIAQMIKYRLEVGASTPEGQVTRRATSKSGNKVEAFGWGSCWDDAYKDMLNPSGNIGQYIKWQRVEEFITDKIVTTTTGSRAGKKSPEELWGDIRSIDDDESDTEVDADKYGPSRDKD